MLCGSVELSILHWIQDHLQCGFMDTVMPWITKLGDSGISASCWHWCCCA